MKKTKIFAWLVCAKLAMSIVLVSAPAEEGDKETGKREQPPSRTDFGFGDIIGALKSSPGCIGIEMARSRGGKQLIFAWFKDKKACVAWYESKAHQDLLDRFFSDAPRAGVLVGVPDDVGPIMAIASITPLDKPQLRATKLPFSQIAIELYAPVKGGLSLGGTFAPKDLKVKGRRDYDLKKPTGDSPKR